MQRESAKLTLEISPETRETPSVPLDEVLAAEPRKAARARDGVVIGTLVAIDADGRPRVDFAGSVARYPLAARSTSSLTEDDLGRDVALMFEAGDPRKPVLLGVIRDPQPVPDRVDRDEAAGDEPGPRLDAEADGQRLVLTADQEIVLRCGKASITLTRAGKVLIRGAYLLSRSSGVNRIKGGSVQIN